MSSQTPAPTTPVLKASDPIATLVGALVTILGVFQVGERLGLTADEVLAAVGALGTIAALARAYLERRNAARVTADMERALQAEFRQGLYKPVPEPRKYQGTGGGPVGLVALILVLLVTPAMACVPGSSVVPTLGAVLSRVDVPSLVRCGSHLPDYGAAARCLGARALTTGLQIALDRAMAATDAATQAGSGAGAADVSEADKRAIASELDAALDQLGQEIDATHEAM